MKKPEIEKKNISIQYNKIINLEEKAGFVQTNEIIELGKKENIINLDKEESETAKSTEIKLETLKHKSTKTFFDIEFDLSQNKILIIINILLIIGILIEIILIIKLFR